MNPNPRIGVLLRRWNASVKLFNCLNPRFGLLGLKRFQREWPEARLLREVPWFGRKTLQEWRSLLERRRAISGGENRTTGLR